MMRNIYVHSFREELRYFNRLKIISNRSIIAGFGYNTSFGLYEKVDFLTCFNFLAATQKVACYRFLNI